MARNTPSDSSRSPEAGTAPRGSVDEPRERVVSSMVSAGLLAVLGALIFAWALRTPQYPWLFAAGAVPWLAGVVMFARAWWRYTHFQGGGAARR